MKTIIRTLTVCIPVLMQLQVTFSQNFTHFSHKDNVHSINITNNEVWIGTTGGLLQKDMAGNNLSTYNVNNGLSANFITAIAVDSAGNRWFGTYDNGIVRYDGTNWTKFVPILSSNKILKINCLEVDGNGILWAGTDQSLFKFDGTAFTPMPAATITGAISTIEVDGARLWVGTVENGLYLFDGTWQHFTTVNGLSSNKINDLAASPDTLFIATDAGLCFRRNAGTTIDPYPTMNKNCLSVAINPINETTWVGTDNGLFRLLPANSYLIPGFSKTRFPLLEFSPLGDLWLGYKTENQGVDMMNMAFSIIPIIAGFNDPTTNSIAQMVSNGYMTYFATNGKGIISYDGANWNTFYNGYAFIKALEFKGDTLFAGTPDGFVFFYGGTNFENNLGGNPVNAIARDKKGKLWFGTNSGYFTWVNNSQSAINTAGLLNSAIIDISIDSLNRVWFLHNNGVTMYDGTTMRQFNLQGLGVMGAELYDIASDTLGGIWIASSMAVINHNGTGYTHYLTDLTNPANKVISICVDNQNIKYFGRAGSGFSMLNLGNWLHFNQEKNLQSHRITNIYAQKNSNTVWFGSDYGGISSLYVWPLHVNINPPYVSTCRGNEVYLNSYAMGGITGNSYQFNWKTRLGNTISNETSIFVKPDVTTEYILEVTDGFLSNRAYAKVEIIDLKPSLISGPEHVCSNTPNVSYSNSDFSRTCQWSIEGGTIISDNTSNSISVSWNVGLPEGKLLLSEFDPYTQCTVSQEISIDFENVIKPNILRKGENLIICTDSGMQYYNWFKDDMPLPAPNRQFFYLDKSLTNYHGLYSVETISNYGCKENSGALEVFDQALKAYPNPSKDVLKIEYFSTSEISSEIVIRDFWGALIGTQPISVFKGQNLFEIDVTKYKSGAYTYSIFNADGTTRNGKFIVE